MRSISLVSVLVLSAFFISPVSAQKPAPPSAVKTSGTKPRAATPRTVAIVATDDMKFSVTSIVARRGEVLQIQLTSRGVMPKIAMAHNVVVLKAGTDALKFVTEGAPFRATDFIAPSMQNSVIAKTPFAGPGETVQVVFTAPSKAGRYPFLCSFSGHFQAGAKGTLIVR